VFGGSPNSKNGQDDSDKYFIVFLKSRFLRASVPKALLSTSSLHCVMGFPFLSGLFNFGLVLARQTY
jgi:hypothetical protein